MLKKIVYALYLTTAFYAIILASMAFGLHAYPATSFEGVGFLGTFLLLFGTVNNVLQGLERR